MMIDWASAVEIADALGVSRRNVSIRANKESWTKRNRAGRGGGFEYQISLLPADVQGIVSTHLAQKVSQLRPEFIDGKRVADKANKRAERDEINTSHNKQAGLAQYNQLTGDAKKRVDAKLRVCMAYKQFLIPYISIGKKVEGEKEFIAQINSKKLDLGQEVTSVIKQVSFSGVRRWVKSLDELGPASLAGNYRAQAERKHLIDEHEELQAFCRGMLFHKPDIQATNLREALKGQIDLGKINVELPSLSSFRRWISSFKREFELVMHQLENPDDFKNTRQVAWGKADEAIKRINQLWELDSTPSDVMLKDGRHSIIGAIDIFSRRPIVIVHPTSSAEAVCILMRKSILQFGVPESVKTDNGKDYTSLRVMSVLDALDIQQVITKPFAGDEKPHIERFFKTWAHGISTLLPGYAGHNVAKRQELRARQSFAAQIMAKKKSKGDDGKMRLSKGADVDVSLTSKELQSIIDEWIEHHYMHKKHRGIGCTPFEKWQSQRTTIRSISNERALDILLSPVPAASGRPAGLRKANKDAGIVVEGISYFAPELGSRIGQSLFCSWDSHDVGQLYVFEPQNMDFICVAKNPEFSGMSVSLSELSAEARKQQNANLAEHKALLRKASKSVSIGDVATDVLEAAKKRNATLSGLPHQEVEYQSSALKNAELATKQPEQERLSRSEFQKQREEQLAMEKAIQAQDAKPRFANQIEEFTYYLRQQDLRELTPDEIAAMNRFRAAQPAAAKMAERLKNGAGESAAKRNQF